MPLVYTGLVQQVFNGSLDGSSASVPKNADGTVQTNPDTGQPYQQIQVTCPMSAADAQTAGNTCRITFRASWDGGNTYQAVGSPYNWSGGIGPKGNFTTPSNGWPVPVDANGVLADSVLANLDTQGNSLNTGLVYTMS